MYIDFFIRILKPYGGYIIKESLVKFICRLGGSIRYYVFGNDSKYVKLWW